MAPMIVLKMMIYCISVSKIRSSQGDNLHAISFESQAAEAFVKCNVLNKMTALGMPKSYVIP
jgi:ABC-type uncharacterized transport system fused permease/ATPase subunit